jgi:hypothetical protein
MTIPQQSAFLPATQEKHLSKNGTAQKHIPSNLKYKPKQNNANITTVPPVNKQQTLVNVPALAAPPPALAKTDADDSETETQAIDIDPPSQNVTENSQTFNLYQLIDITPPTRRKHNSAPGRPKKGLLDTFLQQCYRPSQPEKRIFRCVGEGCSMTFTNRNLPRTLKHAHTCNKLPKHVRLKAKQVTAKSALSRKVLKDKQESSESEDKGMESRIMESDEEGGASVVMKKGDPEKACVPAMEFFEEAKMLGRAERHKRLDFAILLLICAAGLPTYLVSRPEWRRVFMIADSTYTPATREKLETEQIVNEAENVAEKQREFLKTQENLTISCDGGTSRGRNAFWTIHVSTPKRKVYLMECREATSESHTGVWIKNFVLEVRVNLLDTCFRLI